MARYIANRIVGMVVVMFLVLTATFIIVRLTPGDPAALMLGPEATAADITQLRHSMGLDQPIPVQYVAFLLAAVHGDLGRSIFFNQPVLQVIFARAEPTTFLTLFSILIAVVIALPVGVLSAYWRGTWFDQGALSTAMLLASIPSFWLGLIFQQHLTGGGILPVSGFGDPGSGFLDQMRYLILPSLVLGLVNSALIIRFSRASMLDVLSDDYVRTARAKGMSEWRVVLRHAFDLSEKETAQRLGISVGTVKSQTSRGVAELTRLLDDHHSGPPGGRLWRGCVVGAGSRGGRRVCRLRWR